MNHYQINKNKFLNKSELEHLTAFIDPRWNRNAILIKLALATGARAQELLNIEPRDLNDQTCSILIYGLKNSNDREIPINRELYNAVKALALNSNGKTVFGIGYQRLVAIWNEYKPVDKSFHCLRHTFAINLYDRTRDLKLVATALGHRQISNTMVYADYIYSTTELRRLLKAV